jgi:Ulp1 family protease
MEKAIGSSGEPIDADVLSSDDEDVLFKFPFVGADNIEKAAVGLPLCATDDGDLYVRSLLKPRTCVKDDIIDFWMLWLSRNCRQKESPEHFFTSHFYTKLTEKGGGLEHVSNWLRRRFSIFEKRIMYFPIYLDNHWSLCVAYNPSIVRETPTNCRYTANSGVPIILHLDSLKLHNSSKIADNIRNLFSYEWQRQFPSVKFKFD